MNADPIMHPSAPHRIPDGITLWDKGIAISPRSIESIELIRESGDYYLTMRSGAQWTISDADLAEISKCSAWWHRAVEDLRRIKA